jgi:hypothetical protein
MKTAVYNKLKKLFAAGHSSKQEAKEAGKLRKKAGRKENERRTAAQEKDSEFYRLKLESALNDLMVKKDTNETINI